MIALQLSSGQGPVECARAVTLAWQRVLAEAQAAGVEVTLLEQLEGPVPNTHRSVVLGLEGEQATALARRWQGTVQWVCQSPYRKTGRKNWFLSAQVFDWGTATSQLDPKDVRIEAMRSSGAGGQHVNKTSSAVRATHVPTGLTVRCDSERSQHANKRWALAWLSQKIQQADDEAAGAARATRRQAHHEVERGQGGRVFRGLGFTP